MNNFHKKQIPNLVFRAKILLHNENCVTKGNEQFTKLYFENIIHFIRNIYCSFEKEKYTTNLVKFLMNCLFRTY